MSDRDDPALSDTELAAPRPRGDAATSSWVGTVVDGRYEIASVLGRGGMGVVYRAREPLLGRDVALKTIATERVEDEDFAQRFHEEARALARVRHPNVVQIHTFGVHEDAWFLVMEFVRGASLAHVVALHDERNAQISPHNAVGILTQVIDGAAAIHAAGLVHCDLKPANVVVEDDTGRPVIVDFGVVAEARHDRDAALGGSPGYMAPEQGMASPQPTIDVYALGCIAYELLAGALPYPARSVGELMRMHKEAPVPRLSEVRPELAPFDGVLARAMAKQPEDRFRDGAEMLGALVEAHQRWHSRPSPTGSIARTDDGEPSILVVDDDPGFRAAVARAARLAFPDAGMRVVTAATGEEAVRIALDQLPRVVLLDYMLPRLDGVATLSVLRSLPGGHDLRVVVISGSVEDARWQFVALGVRHFLAKPVELATLVRTMSELVDD